MAKSASSTYQDARDAFRKNPSAANKKKFLEARVKYIAQRPENKKPVAKKKATKKK